MSTRTGWIGRRSQNRRRRIVVHLTDNYKEAEKWDLSFWQSQTPAQRLSAHVAILEDAEKVKRARTRHECNK